MILNDTNTCIMMVIVDFLYILKQAHITFEIFFTVYKHPKPYEVVDAPTF